MQPTESLLETQAILNLDTTPTPLNRRQALQWGLGMGYAIAATHGATAQTTIKTPSDGLITREVMVDVAGFSVPVFQAQPQGTAPRQGWPVILVISEIFGVHEYIADVARRFAKAGYMALAPDLFARWGDPQSFGEISKLMSELISKVPDAQVAQDLDGVVAWAAQHGGDTQRLGVTGFCWGGRQTWLYTAHQPKIKAGVAWYGRLVGQSSALSPKHPVDIAGQLHGPVLGLYGEADTGIPVATVDQMKTALQQANTAISRVSELVLYPNAPHAFHADYRPSYRAEAARDGFERCLAWLKRWGV